MIAGRAAAAMVRLVWKNSDRPDPAENLRLALELFEVGEMLYRQKLLRQHPAWSDEAVETAVDEWLQRPAFERPGSAGTSAP